MLQRVLGFLWRHTPRTARRWRVSLWEAQFAVSVGAVVFNDQGQVLLLKHVFRDGSGWGVPGGFINRDEQPEAGLRRELREEINLEVSDVRLRLAHTHPQRRHLELIYVCRADGEAEPQGLEIVEAVWLDPHALPAEVGDDQRRLLTRVLKMPDEATRSGVCYTSDRLFEEDTPAIKAG